MLIFGLTRIAILHKFLRYLGLSQWQISYKMFYKKKIYLLTVGWWRSHEKVEVALSWEINRAKCWTIRSTTVLDFCVTTIFTTRNHTTPIIRIIIVLVIPINWAFVKTLLIIITTTTTTTTIIIIIIIIII